MDARRRERVQLAETVTSVAIPRRRRENSLRKRYMKNLEVP
jgi:hypothetical protein